jgi:hypothetical protein
MQPTKGTTLFVERDRARVRIIRKVVGTCTLSEWRHPVHRQAAIDGLWSALAGSIRSENQALIGPLPVSVWSDPMTGTDVLAHNGRAWIDARGNPLLGQPSTAGLVRRRTTYAHWAEGPRAYAGDHAPEDAPSPLLDRQLQEVRSRNRWLRDLIDPAIAPSFDPVAKDAGKDDLVDFRVRAIVEADDYRVLVSAQTGDAAIVLDDGDRIGLDEIDPAFTHQEA